MIESRPPGSTTPSSQPLPQAAPSLDNLPAELLSMIGSHLDDEALFHLQWTCKANSRVLRGVIEREGRARLESISKLIQNEVSAIKASGSARQYSRGQTACIMDMLELNESLRKLEASVELAEKQKAVNGAKGSDEPVDIKLWKHFNEVVRKILEKRQRRNSLLAEQTSSRKPGDHRCIVS